MNKMHKEPSISSNLYCHAVMAQKSVCVLEQMRSVDIFGWEEEAQQQTYTPSEALLIAIEYDHRAYAEYLLDRFSGSALSMPGEYFACSAPHLIMAVRHNRKQIVALILRTVHREPSLKSYINQGDYIDDGRAALHEACEFLHLEIIVTLLGNGALAQAEDYYGTTPLDLILEQFWDSRQNMYTKRQCLENLVMFITAVNFKTKSSLKKSPERWSDLLGEEMFRYLVGREPASLFHIARKRILSQLPLHEFPQSIDKLPIPTSLKSFTQHVPST